MRILHLHMFDMGSGWGGSASMVVALHAALTELGHNVGVVSARRPDPYGLTVSELPFDCKLTFGPEKRKGETSIDDLSTATLADMALATATKLEREALNEGVPQLLIANHISIMALACWHLSKKLGIPYRIISYGTDTLLLLQDQRYRELFGVAAREAERIFTISEFVAKDVASTVGGKIEVLGGAVDPKLFFPSQQLPRSNDGLVYFGRFVTEKGIWTLLDAFRKQRSAQKLVLVGEGPLRDDIGEFITHGRLRSRVKLLDFVPQSKLRELLVRSAAVVVPSVWQEPLGLVVLEALACGVPVIASAVGGIPEILRHNFNGLLFPKGDHVALANAIDRLLGDKTFYSQTVQNVRVTTIPTHHDIARRLTGNSNSPE